MGYTPRQIDELTLSEVRAFHNHWRKHPPTHLLVAWFVGFKPSEPQNAEQEELEAEDYITKVSSAEFDELLRQHGIAPKGT